MPARLDRIRQRLGDALAGRPIEPLPGAPRALLELLRDGPAPLADRRAPDAALDVAVVIPAFRRGSGGHQTIARLLGGLQALGHRVSLWLEDDAARHDGQSATELAASFGDFFGFRLDSLRTDFASFDGADVALATGWQTAAQVLLLPDCAARAYLVQDHEPDFYGASAEAAWAAESYGWGLHCIAASGWLAELLRSRYGASASHFDLGVDHSVYAPPAADARRPELVAFYARAVTPRRAVPLGLLALEELKRRRPAVELVLFGDSRPLGTGLAHRNLGVADHAGLAALYRQATVGMALSMTNPSLVTLEMLASGLPCVELDSEPVRATFGEGPLELASFDPLALADALERLLDDGALRARRAAAGLELARERSWERAAEQVRDGLLAAFVAAEPAGSD